MEVGYVDGNPFVRYDSETEKMKPQVDWIAANVDQEYWDGQTRNAKRTQEVDRVNLVTVRGRYNQTGSECGLGWGLRGAGMGAPWGWDGAPWDGRVPTRPPRSCPAHATASLCVSPSLPSVVVPGLPAPLCPHLRGPGCLVPAPQCLGSPVLDAGGASGHPSAPPQCSAPPSGDWEVPSRPIPAPHQPHGLKQRGSQPVCQPHGRQDPQHQRGSQPLALPMVLRAPITEPEGLPPPCPSSVSSHPPAFRTRPSPSLCPGAMGLGASPAVLWVQGVCVTASRDTPGTASPRTGGSSRAGARFPQTSGRAGAGGSAGGSVPH